MIRCLLLALLASVAGCTQKVSSKLATYQIGAPAVQQAVKTSGTYEIKWVDERGKKHHTVEMAGVKLRKGETVGFGTRDDGSVIALAGEKQLELPALPPEATYCLWYHKTRRETQLAKNLRSAGVLAGDVAGTMAMEGIWQSMGLEPGSYEFTRDKKGNLRLTPAEDCTQPRKPWNAYDELERSRGCTR